MRIYAIYNKPQQTFVRWGINGGGYEGYCLFCGRRCFFLSLREAIEVVGSFDNPDDYEIRTFEEV